MYILYTCMYCQWVTTCCMYNNVHTVYMHVLSMGYYMCTICAYMYVKQKPVITYTLANKVSLQHDVLCVPIMCWLDSDLLYCVPDYIDTMLSFSSLLPPDTSSQSDYHFPEQSTSRPPSTIGEKRATTITEDEQGETGVVYMLYFIY